MKKAPAKPRKRTANKAVDERNPFIHGANLQEKETHRTKYKDETSKKYLAELRPHYNEWRDANLALIGPRSQPVADDRTIVLQRLELLNTYKDLLDQQHYAEHFDSRSNLHSSVLEEFMYYLFKDLVADFGERALIGKSHTFKDIFFSPPNYAQMLKRPYAGIERKDHDFVIGTTIEASFSASVPPAQDDKDRSEKAVIVTEEPSDYNVVTVTSDAETHIFDIPAIAIECKTYLDKTMLEGSSRAAEELKARNPNGLYIVVMEWIKLAEAVNLRKYKVDQIYVLRKQKNTDREFRYLEGYEKNVIDGDVVWHLFTYVRDYLTADWLGGIENGLQRGWLI